MAAIRPSIGPMPGPKRSAGNRRITIKEVARAAGVSPTTVSLSLNGRAAEVGVSQARVEDIRRIASELGYRPSLLGYSIRTDKTRLVGALVRNNAKERFFNLAAYEFLLGLNERLEAADHSMCVVRLGDIEDEAASPGRLFREHWLDAVVAVGPVGEDLAAKVNQAVPATVLLDGAFWRDQRCLMRDERAAGRLAAQSLADAGRKRLVWVPGVRRASRALEDRWQGVQDLARERGLPLTVAEHGYVAQVPEADFVPEAGLVAYNSVVASRLGHLAAMLGRRPGADVGIASCEDSHELGRTWPELTRVQFDRFAMGVAAAEMALALIADPQADCPSRLLAGGLIAGKTA